MSDEFEPPRPGPRPARPAARPRHPGGRRRPSPLLMTAIVLVVLFLMLSLFTGVWTDRSSGSTASASPASSPSCCGPASRCSSSSGC